MATWIKGKNGTFIKTKYVRNIYYEEIHHDCIKYFCFLRNGETFLLNIFTDRDEARAYDQYLSNLLSC